MKKTTIQSKKSKRNQPTTMTAHRHRSYVAFLRRQGLSKTTIENKTSMFRTFICWVKENNLHEIENLTSQDLENFQVWLCKSYRHKGKKLSPMTTRSYVTMLRGYFGWLEKQNHIINNPCKLKMPKKIKRVHTDILSPPELVKLVESFKGNDTRSKMEEMAVRLLIFSVARASDICNLKVKDLDIRNRTFIVRAGKMGIDRSCFYDIHTKHHLVHYLHKVRPQITDSEWLFVNQSGTKFTPQQLRTITQEAAKRAKVKQLKGCHSIRRSMITALLECGVSMKMVAEIAGHSIETSADYAKVSIQTLQREYNRTHPFAGDHE